MTKKNFIFPIFLRLKKTSTIELQYRYSPILLRPKKTSTTEFSLVSENNTFEQKPFFFCSFFFSARCFFPPKTLRTRRPKDFISIRRYGGHFYFLIYIHNIKVTTSTCLATFPLYHSIFPPKPSTPKGELKACLRTF